MTSQAGKCEVCGYVHQGDGPPETCPVCGVGPEMFSPFAVERALSAPSAAAWRCTICDHVHEGEQPPSTCPVCGASRPLFEAQTSRGPVELEVEAVGRVLILGAGIAGVTAAEEARRTSQGVAITLVAKEAGLPYYRLNLTRYLAGEVAEPSLALQPAAWFDEQRVDLTHGDAVRIHRAEHSVELRDGRSLAYDRLILAIGAHAFVPPIPGMTKRGVLPLRTLEDARQILERVSGGMHVLCLGGGLLGLETAGALSRRGARVTVLEGFDWLLPRQLARPAGERLRAHLESLGIGVICGAQVEEMLGDEALAGARLKGGEEIGVDLVVLATGVRPNSHLARTSGLEVGRGVIVDDRMRASDPQIYAAGDVAEHRGVLYGLWPSAYAQGVVAGINAAGGSATFSGLPPSNRLKVLAVDLFSMGQFQPQDASYQVFEHEQPDAIYRLVCRDGRVVGANLYGDTALAGAVKSAIEGQTQLAELPEALLARFPELAHA